MKTRRKNAMIQLLPMLGWSLLAIPCGAQQSATDQPPDAPTRDRQSVHRRLSAKFMETLDHDRAKLARQIKPVDVPYSFVRGTFHMHSHLSHDSQGTLEEITAAAKATGTRIIGFTEHPSRTVDVVGENVKGWHEGVYFLAGTESSNELHWPERDGEDQLRFVCHPEEVPTFDREKYDGMEIYNTHSDAKDEPIEMLLRAMVLNMVAVQAHPEAAFCSFLDRPDEFLARFDRLTMGGRFTGIAANDSHQNQGLSIFALPEGGVEVLDATGEQIWQAEGWQAKMILAAFGQSTAPAERVVLASMQLDPYEISMRHVGTFLQIDTIDEPAVRSALRTGRIMLGFELVAPLPNFGFWIEHGGVAIGTVGDEIPWQEGMTLHVKLPAEAEIRVVRNGTSIADAHSDELEVDAVPSGVYRMDALQQLAGQDYPWVISNPIYVVEPQR